jgi:hypothetical protein
MHLNCYTIKLLFLKRSICMDESIIDDLSLLGIHINGFSDNKKVILPLEVHYGKGRHYRLKDILKNGDIVYHRKDESRIAVYNRKYNALTCSDGRNYKTFYSFLLNGVIRPTIVAKNIIIKRKTTEYYLKAKRTRK